MERVVTSREKEFTMDGSMLLFITAVVASISRVECVIGQDTDIYQYPMIGLLFDDTMKILCPVTLIGPATGITAAHCFDDAEPRSAYFGIDGKNGNHNTQGRVVSVARWTNHPDYAMATRRHDLALVQFLDDSVPQSDLNLENSVSIEKVPQILSEVDTMSFLNGSDCSFIGFGTSQKSDERTDVLFWEAPFSDTLRVFTALAPLTRELCGQVMEKESVTTTHFCTTRTDFGGPCNNDDGGPLMCNIDGVLTLVGLLSKFPPAKYGCLVGANAFTDLSQYSEWITQTMLDDVKFVGDDDDDDDDDDDGGVMMPY